jgi:PAS domain S-box-containing protein
VNRQQQEGIVVRCEAEEQFRVIEDRYRAILSAVTSIVWSTDTRGAYVERQPSWEQYTGQTWEEYREFGWEKVIHPDDREAVNSGWRRALGTGEVYDAQGRIWHAASQSYRHYTCRAIPVKNPDGSIREWVGTLTDVEDRRRSELVQNELAAIVNSSRDAIIGKTLNSLVTSWNPGAERIYGYTCEEAIGRHISMIVPPDRRTEYEHIMDQVRRGESIGPLETVRVRKDGARIDVALSISPVRGADDRVIGASVIARDITENVRAQEKMRRLVRSVEAAKESIILTDTNGNITYINPAFTRLTGYGSNEVIGRTPRILKSGRQDTETYRRIWKTIRKGITWSGEIVNRRKDGSLYDAELTIAPVLDPAGRVEGYVGVQRDISERKRIEQIMEEHLRETDELNTALMRAKHSLDESVAELQRSNKELEDFAYIASHDLKEPLRGIHNYAQFLIEDYADKLDDAGKDKLLTLTRLTRRMEALIDSLLQYSRIGRVDLAFSDVDLDRILAEVVDTFHITPQSKNVKVMIPRPLPRIRCDGAHVAELFRNLIVNAAKYNDKAEKSIEIGWYDDESEIQACIGTAPVLQSEGRGDARLTGPVFFVRDNGIGIPAKHHETVFRIFRRLHGRDKFGGGTGAGLTIVKKIVDRHGGSIWIDSVEGEGTTFYFTLSGIHDHGGSSQRITAHSAG